MSPGPLALIAITDSPLLAAELALDRIMVDLECRGKADRQAGLALRLSGHTLDTVKTISAAIEADRFMVRLDAWSPESVRQIEAVLALGPGTLMLPMVRTPAEVAAFAQAVDGRARLSLLIETVAAVEGINELLDAADVDEIHVGLNDLRIDGGYRFLFEAVANGFLDPVLDAAHTRAIPCGIGGIARLDEGLVPGRLVLAELIRRDAAAVILSRTFARGTAHGEPTDPASVEIFRSEVGLLRTEESRLRDQGTRPDVAAEFQASVARAIAVLESST